MKDYEKTYDGFWKHIIEKDGVVNMDQVKRELHDYSNLMRSASEVYCEVTNSRISKPNTLAAAVIGEFNNYVEELCLDAIRDDRIERGEDPDDDDGESPAPTPATTKREDHAT